jgi:hypothetical protein
LAASVSSYQFEDAVLREVVTIEMLFSCTTSAMKFTTVNSMVSSNG